LVFGALQGPLFSERARWIRDEYSAFGREQRKRVFLEIARFANINRPIEGYYFEFGCHEANTIRMAFDCFRHLFDWHYVAFDSFEGLPEIPEIDRQAIWEKGKLKTSEEEFRRLCSRHGIPRNRLTTVKGFYDVSLTDDLKRRLLPTKAASFTSIATFTRQPSPCFASCAISFNPARSSCSTTGTAFSLTPTAASAALGASSGKAIRICALSLLCRRECKWPSFMSALFPATTR
jgi:hypothetical protein